MLQSNYQRGTRRAPPRKDSHYDRKDLEDRDPRARSVVHVRRRARSDTDSREYSRQSACRRVLANRADNGRRRAQRHR